MSLHAQEAQDSKGTGRFLGDPPAAHGGTNDAVAQPDLYGWGDGEAPRSPRLSCWWGSAQNGDIITSAGHAKAQKAAPPGGAGGVGGRGAWSPLCPAPALQVSPRN